MTGNFAAAITRRLRQRFARILMSTIVGVALMGMVLPPGALMAAGCCGTRAEAAGKERKPVTKQDVARFKTEWEHLAAAAERSLDELDRTRFDLVALHRALGDDPETIFRWVRENTRWVPYRGALKGPVGVLLARQGNTLDRALLLARLLELAGHSVQIANGEPSRRRLPDLEKVARASMKSALKFQANRKADDSAKHRAEAQGPRSKAAKSPLRDGRERGSALSRCSNGNLFSLAN